MRKNVAYCLLLLYSLTVCKSVLPIFQDEFAHLFWKAHHLATVHHYHGDQHAEAEISHSTQEEDSKQNPAALKNSEPVSVHLVEYSLFFIQPLSLQLPLHGTKQFPVASPWLDKKYPPPRVC